MSDGMNDGNGGSTSESRSDSPRDGKPAAAGEAGATKSVALVLETVIDAPVAALWRALTDPALVARWLLPNDMPAEAATQAGSTFSFDAPAALGGRIACTVVESEPPHRLVYSWRIAAPEGALATRVTFTVSERPDGRAHLKLVHDGFRVAEERAVDRLAEPEILVLLPPLRARRLPKRRQRLLHARRAIPLVMRLAA